jgi:anion-transporting  ArsA/GET3 family ATPase
MSSPLEHQLLVVTGKGGVGKTTVAAALGLLAAQRGLRTIVVEMGDQRRLPALFGLAAHDPGVETKLQERLSSISIDPDRALLEWLQTLGGRVSGRVLASSSTFQYFAAAAPGARELVSMVKIWELTQGERWRKRAAGYDLVVLDAPATGHALGMLHSPQTFGAIARVGPIAGQAQRVRELLEDPTRSDYLAVAQGTEMAISETLEVQDGLRRQLGRELHTVLVNGVLPRRFTGAELRRIDPLSGSDPLRASAALAARAVHDRARFQHNQLARLRRRHFEVLGVPFLFAAELDLPAVRRIAEHLGRKL